MLKEYLNLLFELGLVLGDKIVDTRSECESSMTMDTVKTDLIQVAFAIYD